MPTYDDGEGNTRTYRDNDDNSYQDMGGNKGSSCAALLGGILVIIILVVIL